MRLFALYWGVVIVLLPIFYRFTYLGDGRWHKNTLFVWVSLLSFILFGSGDRRPPKYLLISSSVLAVLGFFNQYSIMSGAVVWQMVSFLCGLGLLFQLYSKIDEYDKRILINAFSVAAVIQSVWFISQYFGYDPYYFAIDQYWNDGDGVKKMVTAGVETKIVSAKAEISVIGSLGQQTLSGCFLATLMPFLLRKKWIIFIIPALFALYLTDSAMAIMGGIGGLLVSGLLYKKPDFKLRYLAVAGLALSWPAYWLMKNVTFFSDQLRLYVWGRVLSWYSGWDVLWGRGLGYVHDTFNVYTPLRPRWIYLHNEYLELYAAFGLIGVVCGIVFMLPVIKSNKEEYFWFGGLAAGS